MKSCKVRAVIFNRSFTTWQCYNVGCMFSMYLYTIICEIWIFFLFLNQNKNVFDESFDIIIVFSLNMVSEFYAKRIKGRVWRYFPIWRKIRHFYFFNTRSHRENATQTVVILFFLLIFIFAFDCLLIMSRFCSFCLWWHFGGGSVRF